MREIKAIISRHSPATLAGYHQPDNTQYSMEPFLFICPHIEVGSTGHWPPKSGVFIIVALKALLSVWWNEFHELVARGDTVLGCKNICSMAMPAAMVSQLLGSR